MQFGASDVVRLPDLRDQALVDDLADLFHVRDAIEDHHELVAAKPRHGVAVAHHVEQPACN